MVPHCLYCAAADLKNGSGSLYQGECKDGKADCTITLSDDDLVAMALQQLEPQKASPPSSPHVSAQGELYLELQAFFQGKVKLAGNILLAQKLQSLFPSTQSKL